MQGLGLVITGTMPVFNLTADGNSKVRFEQLSVNELLLICSMCALQDNTNVALRRCVPH